MIKVCLISHATFETPDLEALIEHYTKVTGLVVAAREKGRAMLSTILDEEIGIFDPRPWHEDQPQRPKVRSRANRSIAGWGPPPSPDWHMNPDE